MLPPSRPATEAARLTALRRYCLLDTPPEPSLDDLTDLAAQICATPGALISLVDDQRQWFKSNIGMPVAETRREISFCGHAILQQDVFVVPDALSDTRFVDNPLVRGAPFVRFYAGVPLVTEDGHAIGTLCVFDHVARELMPAQQRGLEVLGRQVIAQIELRRRMRQKDESEARLRVVTDSARIGLVIVSPERRYVYANQTYADILELGSADIVGLRVADVLSDVYERQIRPRLDRAFAGERVAYELHRERVGGPAMHFAVRYEPTLVEGSRMVVVVITDITDLRATEAELRTNNELLASVMASTPSYIFATDRQHRYLLANEAYARFVGRQASEILGRTHADFFSLEQAAVFVADNTSIMEMGLARQLEETVLGAKLLTVKFPLRDHLGGVIGVCGVVTDVTANWQAEEARRAVRTAEDRMRFALESAGVGVWDLDVGTRTAQWSQIVEAQHGLPPGTFDGTLDAFLARIHSDDRGLVDDAILQGQQGAGDFTQQYRAVWPDGTVRWISAIGRFHRDENGQPLRAVGVTLDVTERHTLEAQYQQAQKMEAVGRLAGGVAHDFNNLLTAILGYCELLLNDARLAGDCRVDVVEIQEAGKRAAALTRQLLTFSRRSIVEPSVLDLNTVVGDLKAMMGRLIGEDIVVHLDLPDGVAPILADKGQIEQIVLNLAVNSRDAMPRGGRLRIATANVDVSHGGHRADVPPGRYVMLSVGDTGSGMTPEVQAHLFEPFYTTKAVGQGTGLGLATVHGIVTRYGGGIAVESAAGRGTTVSVYFPRAADGAVAGDTGAAPRPLAGRETVLVVDDADGPRELSRRLLQRLGYTVLTAMSADDALRVFEEQVHVDVLLTDVVMPGESGADLGAMLLERQPSLKVVYMSGYTDDKILHHGIRNSDIAFLAKPFTGDTLSRKLREVLDAKD